MNKSIVMVVSGAVISSIGFMVNENHLWSGLSNMAIPWLCTVLGVSLSLGAVHNFIRPRSGSGKSWLLYGVVVCVAAIAVFTDSIGYPKGFGGDPKLLYNEIEIFGFAVVYAVVLIATADPKDVQQQSQADS